MPACPRLFLRHGAPSLRAPCSLVAVALIGAGGILAGVLTGLSTHRQGIEELLRRVRSMAATFEAADLRQLRGQTTEVTANDYARLKARLRRVAVVDPDDRFLYIFHWEEAVDRVVFVADSAEPGSKEESKPGDEYRNYRDPRLSPGLRTVLRTGEPSWEGPETDEFGTWYSAFAVLPAPAGRYVLGLDRDVAKWNERIAVSSALACALCWLVGGGLLLTYLHRLASRHTISTLQELGRQREEMDRRRLTELEAENRRYDLLARTVPVAILRVDHNGHCVFVNDEGRRITQIEATAIRNRRWLRIFDSADRRACREAWRALIREGRPFSGGLRLRLPDGSARWVFGSAVRESPTTFVGAFVDRTGEKLTEMRLEQYQRFDALGTLAGSIVLEMRNALTPILLGVEALRRSPVPGRDPLFAIESGARLTSEILQQLMAFTEGNPGTSEPLEINTLLADIERTLRLTLPKQIQIVRVPLSGPSTAVGRRAHLQQALFNLCMNARDALPTGGTLRLSVRRQTVDTAFARTVPGAHPGEFIVASVFDSGGGIPAGLQGKIFEPFFTTKASLGRPGLGLAAVARITRSHGGFVSFYSEPNRGTEFSLYLPAIPTAAAAGEVPVAPSAKIDGRGRVVLFVDDEPLIREAAESVLTTHHFTVHLAADGIDGLCRAAEIGERLDLVITDRQMPGMDGIEFIHALRPLVPETPVVLVSGRIGTSPEEPLTGLNLAATIVKPFTSESLLRGVAAALSPGNGGSGPGPGTRSTPA
ncbi:MAG: response regulator [Verrucomicrobia bacterium]|nr:response regulator [Verrucomicrobiota bacterium]